MDRCFFAFIWTVLTGCVLLIALVIGGLVFAGVDSVSGSSHVGMGCVVGRSNSPGYYQTSSIQVGDVSVPNNIWINESWSLIFEVEGVKSSLSVDQTTYYFVPDGWIVPITYQKGRFTSNIYVSSADFTRPIFASALCTTKVEK